MFKKIILTIAILFSIVSISTAQGYEYITFPESGVIEVDLLHMPGNEWGMWDIMLYNFTEDGNGNVTIGEDNMIDLFWDGDSQRDIIYLTINNGIMTNGLPNCPDCYNSLEMTSFDLGVAFGFGPDDNFTEWYSHYSLNDGNNHHFHIEGRFDNPPVMIGLYDNLGNGIGAMGMHIVPVPGAVWLLLSGLVGLISIRRR